MTVLTFGLVLISAFCHATWNLLAKRVKDGGAPFIWLFCTLATFIYFPVMLIVFLYQRQSITLLQFGFIIGSTLLHLVYSILLQRGYRTGDLSVVYPLARGTGPLLSTIAAIILFKERPSLLALCGIILIIGGVFVLVGGFRQIRQIRAQSALFFALATGLFIATYTIWDKYAVSILLISPIFFDWCSNACRSLLLLPLAIRQRTTVTLLWRQHWREALGVAILGSLAYMLILIAFTFSTVSYIAPLREMSILIGALMGTRLLAEGDAGRRLSAAAIIVLGVGILALN